MSILCTLSTRHTPLLFPLQTSSVQFFAGSLVCNWGCTLRGIGLHIAANRCLGHRPSSLAMTPRVCWIISVPDRSCGLLFSLLLFCVVGLSSARSTKPFRVGISYIANLYSTIWSKRGFHNSLLFAQAVFVNSPVCNMHVCSGSWKLGDLLEWKLQTRTRFRELWKYETITSAKIVL